jgi:hypothetical protein
MKGSTMVRRILVVVVVLVSALFAALTHGQLVHAGGNPNSGVFPPGSNPFGATYGVWSARWWQWALGQPVPTNPLLDTTGASCAVGQAGPVWFLAGTFGGGSATRTCAIPAGKALFVPVANSFCSEEGDGTPEAQRACAKAFMDTATDLSAEVDGVSIQNLQLYRVQSPIFDLTLPDNNIFGAPAGVYTPTAADGIQLMLAPLRAGSHVIHFHSVFAGSAPIDITYHLTVGSSSP